MTRMQLDDKLWRHFWALTGTLTVLFLLLLGREDIVGFLLGCAIASHGIQLTITIIHHRGHHGAKPKYPHNLN